MGRAPGLLGTGVWKKNGVHSFCSHWLEKKRLGKKERRRSMKKGHAGGAACSTTSSTDVKNEGTRRRGHLRR